MLLPSPRIFARDLQAGQLVGWVVEKFSLYDVHKALRVLAVNRNDDGTLCVEVKDPISGEQWRYNRVDRSRELRLLTEHYPTCNQCGQLWPCRDELILAESKHAREVLDAQCVVCGDRWGARMAEVKTETPDGVAVRRYHTRKGSACRKEYLRVVANDPIALAALRSEDAGWSRK